MRIGSRTIDQGHEPLIIAEIGVNHDGSLQRALGLVAAARDAGADAVKFQWFEADRLLSSAARLARYQARTGAHDPHAMLRALELDADEIARAAAVAGSYGLAAIVTVFSPETAAEANVMTWDAFKTASPDVVNLPLIEALMATAKPLIVSTGAASAAEIESVTDRLGDHPHVLMQCVSAYPTPDESAALAGRAAMRRINPNALGYSDHTMSVDTGALAVASGACVLEKHLTYDRRAAGPDHALSLDADGFAEYVRLARRAWTMLGARDKRVLEIEQDVRQASRQSVTTLRALPAGHVLARGELTIKRPGVGIAPARLAEVVGRRLVRAVEADVPLRDEDLQ